MKRNYIIACAGIAAAGLALIFASSFRRDTRSLYKPSAETEIRVSGEEEEEEAGGAIRWYNARLRNELTNRVEPSDLAEIQDRARTSYAHAATARNGNTQTASASWTELGPDNVGGRTRALLIDNVNPNHMFAGAVSGGMWESFDGANNWHRCDGFFQVAGVNIKINCIAQGPTGKIYVGTGESDFYTDYGTGEGGFIGDGIFESDDHGATWSHLQSTTNNNLQTTGSAWAAVNKIAVDPSDANHIYAATTRGFQISTDGGATWNAPAAISILSSTDVEVTNTGKVIAVYGGRPWMSTDNGSTFSNVGTSAQGFSPGTPARTEIAIAPSDPNYVYAFCADGTGAMLGVWVSLDGAASWTQVCGVGNAGFDPFEQSQGTYDNIVSVDPTNPQRAIFGGVELWEWTMINNNPPSGQWNRIALEFTNPLNQFYVHSDKHTIVWHPYNPGTFFIGTDGGIFRTTNYHTTNNPPGYIVMNQGYNVTQCYSVACDMTCTAKNRAVAGCQDNGTQFINGFGNTIMSAAQINGGDGAQTAISFLNPNAIFSTVYYGQLKRSGNYGNTNTAFYPPRITTAANYGMPGFASFVTPISLWESENDTLSPDSVILANGKSQLIVGTTGVNQIHFNGTIYNPVLHADQLPTIVSDSVKFIIGNNAVVLTCAANGALNGPVTSNSYLDLSTGVFSFTLNSALPAGLIIKAVFDTKYNVGTEFTLSSNIPGRDLKYVVPTMFFPGDTFRVQDQIQARLAVGFTSNNGVWMTRRPVSFNVAPVWIKIGGLHSKPDVYNGEASCLAWTPNGDHLYVATGGVTGTNFYVYRFDSLGSVIDSANGDVDFRNTANQTCIARCHLIGSFNRPITAMDVDPANGENVMISFGKLGNTTCIYYSDNAQSASSAAAANWVNKSGNLSTVGGIPVYSICMDKYVPNRVLVGTEHGVFETTNFNSASPSWTLAMNGLDADVPVDAIHQQRWDAWLVPNAGCFYIGTHGRGIWRDDSSWQQPNGIEDPAQPGSHSGNSGTTLEIFPNPVADYTQVKFNLAAPGSVTMQIFDLSGKIVFTQTYECLPAGDNILPVDASNFSKGTYLLAITQGGSKVGVGKFLKME